MSKKIDELRWIRVFTPDHIPHYLIEQIRDREFSVEDFFKYHKINCLIQENDGIILNPFNHLYVLADKENHVKGMLWFRVDPLSKDILIQTFSMHRDYWGKGHAVKKLKDHILEINKKGKLNKIYWITNYPKHSKKYGFKPSKSVLMEYDPNKEVKNGKNYDGGYKSERKCKSSDSRTAELPVKCDGGTSANGTADESGAIPADVPAVVC